ANAVRLVVAPVGEAGRQVPDAGDPPWGSGDAEIVRRQAEREAVRAVHAILPVVEIAILRLDVRGGEVLFEVGFQLPDVVDRHAEVAEAGPAAGALHPRSLPEDADVQKAVGDRDVAGIGSPQ